MAGDLVRQKQGNVGLVNAHCVKSTFNVIFHSAAQTAKDRIMQQLSKSLPLALKNQNAAEAMRLVIGFARLHDNQTISSEKLAEMQREAVKGICWAASERENWKAASEIILSLIPIKGNFGFIKRVVMSQIQLGDNKNVRELMQSAPDYKWQLLFKSAIELFCYHRVRMRDTALKLLPFIEDSEDRATLHAYIDRKCPEVDVTSELTMKDLLPPNACTSEVNEIDEYISVRSNLSPKKSYPVTEETDEDEISSDELLWGIENEFDNHIKAKDFQNASSDFHNAVLISTKCDWDTADMVLETMAEKLAQAGRGAEVVRVVMDGHRRSLFSLILGIAKADDLKNAGQLIPVFVADVSSAYDCAKVLTYLLPMQAGDIVEVINRF